jgi:hypothetical protein
MIDYDEDAFRRGFEELATDPSGPLDPLDPAELAGAWDRFRQERLAAVLAEARGLPDVEARVIHVMHAMQYWLTAEAFREVFREDGRLASAFEVGPDGKLREHWFEKGG